MSKKTDKKTNPLYHEMEIKIEAQELDVAEFNRWCFARTPSKYLHVIGPDTYYVQGKNVLRHRKNGEGAGELTVKRRRSTKSTRDRLEIDLRFSEKNTVEDVQRFLEATGWTEEFTVLKDCHIHWFEQDFPHVEIVVYDVRCVLPNGKETPTKRFLEVEISKEHSGHVRGLYTLKNWERDIRKAFRVGETMGESLYEIYSGRRYGLASEGPL
jgi:adenylate cyclase class IV